MICEKSTEVLRVRVILPQKAVQEIPRLSTAVCPKERHNDEHITHRFQQQQQQEEEDPRVPNIRKRMENSQPLLPIRMDRRTPLWELPTVFKIHLKSLPRHFKTRREKNYPPICNDQSPRNELRLVVRHPILPLRLQLPLQVTQWQLPSRKLFVQVRAHRRKLKVI